MLDSVSIFQSSIKEPFTVHRQQRRRTKAKKKSFSIINHQSQVSGPGIASSTRSLKWRVK
jgi:hypothetical protein